jgi:putative transposase
MQILEAGGTANHVHLLLVLPSDMPLSKAVQVLKANSSRWMGEHGLNFEWQQGYGAFSVSASNAASVREYIAKQTEHHRKRSFEEEFVALLRKCGVDYDPKFVFG